MGNVGAGRKGVSNTGLVGSERRPRDRRADGDGCARRTQHLQFAEDRSVVCRLRPAAHRAKCVVAGGNKVTGIGWEIARRHGLNFREVIVLCRWHLVVVMQPVARAT